VLQVLKDTTLFFLHNTPNLAMVIPAIDYIDETFTNSMLSKGRLDPAIQAAIELAKKTLNWYYSLTDCSGLYCIAMGNYFSLYLMDFDDSLTISIVLHPHHKLEYFKLAGWEVEWIATTHQLVRDSFDESHATHYVPGELDNTVGLEGQVTFSLF